MNETIRRKAILLYDRFTHEGMERRAFMAEMAMLAGSFAAAELLVAAIAASPAAAAIVDPDDKRLTTYPAVLRIGYQAYVAAPRTGKPKANVLVIHENRGLNDHIRDVARRIALAGYRAVAPDMLSPSGGTPANEDAAREAIGKLDLAKSVSDALEMLHEFQHSDARRIGAIGFCWGGGFVNRLAVAAGGDLAGAVAYYGPAPDPSEAPQVEAAMAFHNASLDDRVNATSFPWIEALRANRKTVKFFLYEGVNHAFNNDTSAERYNKPAADLAWRRTLDFFKRHLG